MELEHQQSATWEGYANWRNKPALRGRHGGMLAASFVLVVEVLENLAYLANASNLVLYLKQYMHLSPSKSANNVTNFMGTAFLLALLGGFLSDSFFTTYHIYLISAVIEFLVTMSSTSFLCLQEHDAGTNVQLIQRDETLGPLSNAHAPFGTLEVRREKWK